MEEGKQGSLEGALFRIYKALRRNSGKRAEPRLPLLPSAGGKAKPKALSKYMGPEFT